MSAYWQAKELLMTRSSLEMYMRSFDGDNVDLLEYMAPLVIKLYGSMSQDMILNFCLWLTQDKDHVVPIVKFLIAHDVSDDAITSVYLANVHHMVPYAFMHQINEMLDSH